MTSLPTSLPTSRHAGLTLTGLALFALLATAPARAAESHAAHAAHQHGGVHLDIAIDDQTLVIEMEAPLDSLLGFERAPRTAAEKQAAQAMLARLKQADNLFMPDAAAACTFASSEARSAVLEPGAKAAGEHADLDGRFTWRCQQPGALRAIDLGGLLDAFRRIQRLEVQVASPAGQFKPSVTRQQRVVRWGR